MNGTLLEENVCFVNENNGVPRMSNVEYLSQFRVQSSGVVAQVTSTDDIKRFSDIYSL